MEREENKSNYFFHFIQWNFILFLIMLINFNKLLNITLKLAILV